ncbi:MAG TPA: acyl carrier protein [Mucilaginibacter sp.]|jgi:acyl carrier protein|nr:acyl carrier protein [Mucilaginibacter sp.]
MNDVRSKIARILADNLALDESQITDASKFYEDLEVDSLDFCEVIVDIERALNITIPDDDVFRLTTFGALVRYVEKKADQRNLREVA